MSGVVVGGLGAVSPAGWGLKALREAISKAERCPTQILPRTGGTSSPRPLRARQVPTPAERPACFQHPRLRRSSAITRFAVSAGLEALGKDNVARLGIITCVMSGCVNYSRRFYHEVLENPAEASPLLFPETVFNAPASHLGSVLGNISLNYTLVGDPGAFVQGLALGANWVVEGRVDGCLVVGRYTIRRATQARTAARIAAGAPVPRTRQLAAWPVEDRGHSGTSQFQRQEGGKHKREPVSLEWHSYESRTSRPIRMQL